MTEAEWNACTDPQAMLDFLWGKASDRKLRLFAVACCRRIWKLMLDERSRNAVEASERYAEGETDNQCLMSARYEAGLAKQHTSHPSRASTSNWRAANAAQDSTRDRGWHAAMNCVLESSRAINPHDTNHCDPREMPRQADLLRDLLGPSAFRSIVIDPASLTSTATSLARAIYTDRTFDRLPILADALEDSGCTNADILSHCRQPGEHCRGCWVLDLLLGKE